jgi:hypothetical protein
LGRDLAAGFGQRVPQKLEPRRRHDGLQLALDSLHYRSRWILLKLRVQSEGKSSDFSILRHSLERNILISGQNVRERSITSSGCCRTMVLAT